MDKDMKQLIRTIIDALDKPIIRHCLPPVVSLLAVVKNRTPFALVYFRNGVWVNRQISGVILDRRVNMQSFKQFERDAQEMYGLVYVPKPGDTIVDVGAGIGSEVYYYSKMVGKTGRVIAIEAHPVTFACLREFCEVNKLDNVVALHVAVGDCDGSVMIDDRADHVANSIMGTKAGSPVPLKTLDRILEEQGLGEIDFLKMNIEGAEKLAVVGMKTCISRIKTICMCCHDFIADAGGSDDVRTMAVVRGFLQENQFTIHERSTDKRGWIRDQLNGTRD